MANNQSTLDTILTVDAENASQISEFRLSKKEKVFITEANVTTTNIVKTRTAKGGSYARGYTIKSNTDAEKGTPVIYTNLCWAATASNMYMKAGWGKNGSRTFASEDEVLTYFTQCVGYDYSGKSYGGYPQAGVEWLLHGLDSYNELYFGVRVRNSGCFHSDAPQDACSYSWNKTRTGVFSDTSSGYDCLKVVDDKLRAGYTAGLGLFGFAIKGSQSYSTGMGHAITIAGFTYNEKKKGSAEYYTGLIVADSDDDWNLDDPSGAPNVYKVLSITWDSKNGAYYFSEKNSNYSVSKQKIQGNSYTIRYYLLGFTVLAPNTTASTSVNLTVSADSDSDLSSEYEITDEAAGFSAAEELVPETHYDVVVKDGETFDISGDQAYRTQVQSGGELKSGKDSYAQDTEIQKGGTWNMTDNASAEAAVVSGNAVLSGQAQLSGAVIQDAAEVKVQEQAALKDSDVWNGASVQITGGTVSGTTFHSSDSELVVDGTDVDAFSENNVFNGASQTVTSYAYTANDIFNGGVQTVTGGNVYSTKLNDGAVQYLINGYSYETTIGADSKSIVSEKSTTEKTVVLDGGILEVTNGYADSITVEHGGKIIFGEDSKVLNTSTVSGTIEANSTVSGTAGTTQDGSPVICLDLSNRSFDDDFIINDLSLFKDISFTISLGNAQSWGTYKIAAAGADSFDGTILLSVDSGEFFDEMMVNMSLSSGRYIADLREENGALYFSLDNIYSEQLKQKIVSGKDAVLYSPEQQFKGGSFGEKYQESCTVQMEYAGLYTLTGDFGNLNGTVAVYDGKKKLVSGKLKEGELSIKSVLLEKEKQYSVVVTDSSKGKAASGYSLGIDAQTVFNKAYNDDDWGDLKTAGAEGNIVHMGTISTTGDLYSDWVGYGDTVDYTEISFDTSTRISFDLTASDSTTYTVSKLQSKKHRDGSVTYSLKTLLSKNVKAGESVTTKELLLTQGVYYIGMKSANASKGGDADYTIAVNENSVFYPEGDNSDDTWELAKENQEDAFVSGDTIFDWVGYGDTVDYLKFSTEESGKLSLTFDEDTETAIAKKQLKISCVDNQGKKVSLQSFDGESIVSKKDLTAGEYYIDVSSLNPKKYNIDYQVSFGMLA